MKPTGWRGEPHRHSLAARGIKSRGITYLDMLPVTQHERYAIVGPLSITDNRVWKQDPFLNYIIDKMGEESFEFMFDRVFWSKFRSDTINISFIEYDIGDYDLIGIYGKKSDMVDFFTMMARRRSEERNVIYEVLMRIRNSPVGMDEYVMYTNTDAETFSIGNMFLDYWNEWQRDHFHKRPFSGNMIVGEGEANYDLINMKNILTRGM